MEKRFLGVRATDIVDSVGLTSVNNVSFIFFDLIFRIFNSIYINNLRTETGSDGRMSKNLST